MTFLKKNVGQKRLQAAVKAWQKKGPVVYHQCP